MKTGGFPLQIPGMTRRIGARFLRFAAVAGLVAGCQAHSPGLQAEGQTPVGLESALRLSSAAAAGGDHNAALVILDKTIARFPTEAAPRLALADTYFAMGAIPEAEATYGALVDDQSAGVDALVGLGRLALRDGRPVAAERQFAEALAREPGNVTALNGRAVALDLGGNHVEAQRLYDQALTIDPANRAVLTNRALSLALSGQPDRAVGALAPLASGPTALPEALHNLALAHALAGDMASAERLLRSQLDDAAVRETMQFYRRLPRS
jgi:Flp pilus assembly protein TadD